MAGRHSITAGYDTLPATGHTLVDTPYFFNEKLRVHAISKKNH
jgi:hypothetical protein